MAGHISKKQKIGTHDGIFHCDEVLACYMLRKLPKYSDAEIIRTRDPELLKSCDIVVDVGGIFDISNDKYDHHQREFQETFSSLRPELGNQWNIRLSSAGLIYIYFGKEVMTEIFKKLDVPLLSDADNLIIYKKVYEHFIQEIDAIDNGIPMFDEEPKYRITTDLAARVGSLNPVWNDPPKINVDDLFDKAMKLAGGEFCDKLTYLRMVWWPAREILKVAFNNRLRVHESGAIIELSQIIPWREHLFDLEEEMALKNIVKYVIFEEKPKSWRIICVPVQPKSFVCRKFLHEKWRGLRNERLSDSSGIPGGIFCHSNGFIGGTETREGAIAMGVKSLES